jgi:hypothetical protein
MKLELKRSILSVLNACDGVPAPEVALLTAVRIHAQPEQPTESDILDALGDIERKRFAAAVTDELTGERTWMLTAKGVHKARGDVIRDS